jgi:hypothetical protein
MLGWVFLVVLAGCAIVWADWPLSATMIEVLAVVLAGAVFLIICAVEARQARYRESASGVLG